LLYADLAMNIVRSEGLSSSAWQTQSRDRFWAGVTPLYAYTLAGWLWLFGAGPLAVRSPGYVLISLAALGAGRPGDLRREFANKIICYGNPGSVEWLVRIRIPRCRAK
jgi:hypothetical protein